MMPMLGLQTPELALNGLPGARPGAESGPGSQATGFLGGSCRKPGQGTSSNPRCGELAIAKFLARVLTGATNSKFKR